MMEFTYTPPDVPLRIIYEDRAILVADKPSGLLSVPGKTEGRADCLETRLRRAYPGTLLVHRLECASPSRHGYAWRERERERERSLLTIK